MAVSQLILAVGAILFVYYLVKKPEMIAIALFVAIIADVNFKLNGIPLNFRATMTVCLLARVLLSKDRKPVPPFINHTYTKIIIFFLIYSVGISAAKGLFTFEMLKEGILCFVSAYLAYYYFFMHNNSRVLKISIIIAGLICLLDLAYTYKFVGGFPALRVYYLFTPAFGYMNHNFFGQVCALGFVYLLSDYMNSGKSDKIDLYMMPLMFLGVLLSTSRSALLCVAIVAIGMIAAGLFSAKKGKKAGTLILVVVGCFFLTLFLFQLLQAVFSLNSQFFETITARLIDEPMAMINRQLGNNYNALSLDSMDWRVEASHIAMDTFDGLGLGEKLFGIGIGGFGARNYGNGYDAHNGILLMMIEFGIVGSFIYFAMILSLIYRAMKNKINSPIVAVLVFLIMYITSHNKELVAIFTYLLTGTLVAHLHYAEYGNEYEEITETSGDEAEPIII